MKKNFLFQLLLAAFLLPAFSCSDDDSAPVFITIEQPKLIRNIRV